jgi:hypothetical protein
MAELSGIVVLLKNNILMLCWSLLCCSLQELSSLMAELSGVDLLEATRTDERSTREELRCVLAVVRHGDRTPKQKLKVRVVHRMWPVVIDF